MRGRFFFWILIFTVVLLTCVGEVSAQSSSPRIILYTYYRQMGWGDRVQIGSLDEEGVVRTLTGYDSKLRWPYKPEEQLEYLSKTGEFQVEGTLRSDDLSVIQSLVNSVEDQGNKTVPAANDAGTEKSYAVRYSEEGEPEFILLGVSGDDYFENFDPDAQTLYRALRVLFPNVTCYAYGPFMMGPQGLPATAVP